MKRTSDRRARGAGTTLAEVVVASSLLMIVMVPMLKALTVAQATGRLVERRTQSVIRAQGQLDRIRLRALHHYDESFEARSVDLGGAYRCTVSDDRHPTLRRIVVSVGYDADADGALSADEVQVTLTTLVARIGAD